MIVRGKLCTVTKHAFDGMNAERPPISAHDILELFEDPDHDDANKIHRRTGQRTIVAYYREDEFRIVIRSVSATRTAFGPDVPRTRRSSSSDD